MIRPPPARLSKMITLALMMADDSRFGYSQKPPNGRWGPDFDCSSFIYFIANKAGYNVGSGSDKVRFTGTMLKDFEKAGFQILPFANVGISDLKIGDVLLNLALHAEVYVGDGETVGATSAETGGYNGQAGDQTGHEIEKHSVLTFDKGWDYILRPPDDSDEDIEEGDEEVPMYNQPQNSGMWPNATSQSYPQGYNQPQWHTAPNGYPQGNLGQMNGYSQANAGGYPQGTATDLPFVMGIEGAKNRRGMPNSREALFDEDKPLMYVVGYDYQGMVNDIHVYQFEECSEEMPQHLSPLMHQGNSMGGMLAGTQQYMTRKDVENMLKEMFGDEPAKNESNASGQSANATAGRTR